MSGLFVIGEEARDQALALAERTPLPVTARSLTAAEVARINARFVPIMLGIFLFIALPLLLLFAFNPANARGRRLRSCSSSWCFWP